MPPSVRPAPGGVPVATTRGLVRRVLVTSLVVSALAGGGLVLASSLQAVTLTGALLAVLAASVGVGIVVPTLLWVDRLEGEPPRLLLLCFLWGALVSTAGSLVLNGLGIDLLRSLGIGAELAQGAVGPVVIAPVVEEVLKASGLLLLLLIQRRHISGVVDGIVYAGMIGAGFAFTENVLYLGAAFSEPGGQSFVAMFLVRCLLAPFAHPMMTICVGVGLGFALRRSGAERVVLPLLGLLAAIGLHVLWNASSVISGPVFFGLYLLVQVPLFLAFVVMVLAAQRRQSRLIRRHLPLYVDAGWLTADEVAMVASPQARSRARAWAARNHGRRAARAMEAFQDESAELALTRHHLARGDTDWWPDHEQELLAALGRHREAALGQGGVSGNPAR